LEELVRGGSSELPVGPCINNGFEQKQIDAAFRLGNRLVITECRAKTRSIAFDRGDPRAIQYRQEFVDKVLKDVDEKARWLAMSPKGRNYDVRWAQAIVPIAVTPFVEFIPSLATNYWLAQALPRVLTPQELRAALDNGAISNATQNLVQVSR
jgi:hypothetical protein